MWSLGFVVLAVLRSYSKPNPVFLRSAFGKEAFFLYNWDFGLDISIFQPLPLREKSCWKRVLLEMRHEPVVVVLPWRDGKARACKIRIKLEFDSLQRRALLRHLFVLCHVDKEPYQNLTGMGTQRRDLTELTVTNQNDVGIKGEKGQYFLTAVRGWENKRIKFHACSQGIQDAILFALIYNV